MFDLTDSVIDDIIFAMENQNSESTVNTQTGEVTILSDDMNGFDSWDDAEGEDDDGTAEATERDTANEVDPPEWSSADGFRLMELYASGVADPMIRNELLAALSRGRGVFRAFKDALERHADIARRWYEFKHAAMSRRVAEWYDDLRESSGYARLGPEPEDDEDLIIDDFIIHKAGRERWPECETLFRQGLEQALEHFPESLVEYEFTRMETEISQGGPDDLCLYLAEAPAGALVGVAAVRRVFIADSAFGKLVYLYVMPDDRRMGLGRRLAEKAREDFAEQDIRRFVIDLPFAPDGFGASLAAFGYTAYGTRWIASSY
jgi:ribosomal protein S18 acetylase RimI-like enzyme